MATSDSRRVSAASTSKSVKSKNVDLQLALFTAIANARYRQMKLLIEAGVDVNCADDYATSPLIFCFLHVRDHRRLSRLVKLLLESGADPNSRDEQGRTAIMHMAMLNLTDLLTFLLEQCSINLELQDNEGNTVLMHAASSGSCQSVSILLKFMGRLRQVLHLTQKNNQGYTAVELAERHGHYDVVSLLGGTADRGPTPLSPSPFKSGLPRKAYSFHRQPSSGGVDKDWPSIVVVPSEEEEDQELHPRTTQGPARSFPSLIRVVSVGEPKQPESGSYNQVLNQLDASIKNVQNTIQETENNNNKTVNRNSHNKSYFPPIRPLKKECRSIIAKHTER